MTTLVLAGLTEAQEHVSFSTQDGALIHADLYGKGERGVVLAHGAQFNKESWTVQARALEEAGFRVLAIDFRGYGESRGATSPKSPYENLHLDVLSAVRYLHQSGVKTVSVIGGSMGGGAAAQAAVAANAGEIDRLVLLAAVPIQHPDRIKGRKLFITSRGDALANKVREQYESAPEPKKLVVLEGSAHAQHIFATDQAERLMHEILQFLSEP